MLPAKIHDFNEDVAGKAISQQQNLLHGSLTHKQEHVDKPVFFLFL